jgi:uncharacterized protein YjiS (DUF1127 family)
MNDVLAPALHRAVPPQAGPAAMSRRNTGLAALRGILATWRWRARYRRELAQKFKHDPHLIDDIGLRRGQAETEIAKPFWRR